MQSERQSTRWTREEDTMLLNQIRVFPHNLNKCFHIVAQQTGRTPGAVSAHWYQVLSRKDDICEMFLFYRNGVVKNRKQGMGVSTPSSLWCRLLRLIKPILSSK